MKGSRYLLLLCFTFAIALTLLSSPAVAVHEDALSDLQARVKELEAEKVKAGEKKVDFGGFIRTRYHLSNFATYNAGQILPPDKTVKNADKTANFGEQRARLFISPKLGEYLSGTFAFEFDFRWGDSAYAVGRNQGGGLGADQINIETKDIFFTAKFPGTKLTGIFGLQNVKDAYNGLVLGWADTGGVTFKYAFSEDLNALVGWYRFFQPAAKMKQKSVSADFLRLEVPYTASKQLDVGFNLYAILDRTGEGTGGPGVLGGPPVGTSSNGFAPLSYNRSTGNESLVGDNAYKFNIFMPGVNFKYKLGNFVLDGFAIYEGGKYDSDTAGISDVTISSYAANLAASTKVGATALKLSGIHVSGDDSDKNPTIGIKKNGFYGPGQYSLAGGWMGTTGMKIFFPDIDATNQDAYFVYDVANIMEQRPLGITTVLLTSNTKLSEKLHLEGGLGFLWSTEDRIVNGKNYMGTELNAGLHYAVTRGFSIGVVGAYAWSGNFYKVTDAQAAAFNETKVGNPVAANRDPADLWRTYVRANYAF
jgi:hypothetical protein